MSGCGGRGVVPEPHGTEFALTSNTLKRSLFRFPVKGRWGGDVGRIFGPERPARNAHWPPADINDTPIKICALIAIAGKGVVMSPEADSGA